VTDHAAIFAEHRRFLVGLAYRMLGSVAEAEDVAQDAWLRFGDVDLATLESPRAWLTRVTTRLCLDVLKSARVSRQDYVGPWLPEPMRTDTKVDGDSLSMALLVVLESLSPAERAAFLLCEVFDYSHAEAAPLLEVNVEACRQLLHRARTRLRERRPRFEATPETHSRLLGAFVQAMVVGDLDGLKSVLHDDVVCYSDSGGKVRAARNPVRGPDAVARLWVGLTRKNGVGPNIQAEIVELNSRPALVVRESGLITSALLLEIEADRIIAVDFIRNPDKLARL
jgi:RNA polymerase sigma-70 factor (ECF subfamily)